MLKQGLVVALDTTRNLLRGVTGVRLRLRLSPDRLPSLWAARDVAHEASSRVLALDDYAQIENVLSDLRNDRIEVLELEVLQVDLEDVFVQMMQRH
jgi:ABC-2 type transport system ATP-binding protein